MNGNYAITIARQNGSGGRAVAREISQKLGIDFYDKELITLAAKQSGMSEKVFENFDEKPTNSLLYSLAMGAYAMDGQYVYGGDIAMPLSDKVYKIQSDLIKSLADEKPCIFVGRCADYILSGRPKVLRVFVTDTIENRIDNIMREHNITDRKKAEDYINKNDKRRANYYEFHTNNQWANADNYDLCIRTSTLGLEGTADFIIEFAKKKFGGII